MLRNSFLLNSDFCSDRIVLTVGSIVELRLVDGFKYNVQAKIISMDKEKLIVEVFYVFSDDVIILEGEILKIKGEQFSILNKNVFSCLR